MRFSASIVFVGLISLGIAQETITILPRAMTYGELAAALSTPERSVICSKNVKERALFIALYERDWTFARRLLESELGVRFSEQKDGAWFMDADSTIEKQEAAWRQSYMQSFAQSVQNQVQKWMVSASSSFRTTQLDLLDMESNERALRERLEQNGTNPYADPEYWKLVGDYQEKSWLGSIDAWASLNAMLNVDSAGFYPTLFKQGWAVGTQPIGNLLNGVSARDARELIKFDHTPSEFDHFVFSVEFDLFARCLIGRCDVSGPNGPGSYGALSPFVIRGEPVDFEFRPAGKLDDRAASKAFVQTGNANRKFLVPAGQDFSLSQAIEIYSNEFGAEVVMELFPAREQGAWWMPRLMSGRISLADIVKGWQPAVSVYTHKNEGQGLFYQTWLGVDLSNPTELEKEFDRVFSWSFVEDDGVLRVRNRMRFLDRVQGYPFEAFFAFERAVKSGKDGPLSVRAMLNYCRAVSPEQNAAWARVNRSVYSNGAPYRGVDMSAIAEAYPLLSAIDRSPVGANLVESLEKGAAVTIEMSKFPSQEFNKTATALRALGPRYPQSWHPRLIESLRRSAIYLFPKEDKRTGRVTLEAMLVPPKNSGVNFGPISTEIREFLGGNN